MQWQFASDPQSFEQPVTLDFTQDVWQASNTHFKPRAMQNTALSHQTAFKMLSAVLNQGCSSKTDKGCLKCVIYLFACEHTLTSFQDVTGYWMAGTKIRHRPGCPQIRADLSRAAASLHLQMVFSVWRVCVENVVVWGPAVLFSCTSSWRLSPPWSVGCSHHSNFTGVLNVLSGGCWTKGVCETPVETHQSWSAPLTHIVWMGLG